MEFEERNQNYPLEVQAGIHLHRAIDSFTDHIPPLNNIASSLALTMVTIHG